MALARFLNSMESVRMPVIFMYRFGIQEMITSSILKARWMSI